MGGVTDEQHAESRPESEDAPTLPIESPPERPFLEQAPAAGQWLAGRYELRYQLGRGAMGLVWQAHDHELRRDVALKFVPPDVAHDPLAQDRLREEALAALALSHPNIVKLLHFHRGDDGMFLEMEFVDGPSLSQVLHDTGMVPEDRVTSWLLDICHGLGEAHKRGVIHRDIKPANLLLAPDGSVKVADFGVARVITDTTQRVTGRVITGTLLYMAPEQLRGDPCDTRSDLYSLGATAYELLRGEPPFTTGDITYQHLQKAPESLAEIAPRLWPVVARLLAKSPAARFPDAESLAVALETGDAGAGPAHTAPTRRMPVASAPTSAPVARPRAGHVLGLVTVSAALALLLVLWSRRDGNPEPALPGPISPSVAAAAPPPEAAADAVPPPVTEETAWPAAVPPPGVVDGSPLVAEIEAAQQRAAEAMAGLSPGWTREFAGAWTAANETFERARKAADSGEDPTAVYRRALTGYELIAGVAAVAQQEPAAADEGWTLLHLAARTGRPMAVRGLLSETGQHPNARTTRGVTPLHLAARHGYLEVVRVLLEHGADRQARDADGQTPADYARSAQHFAVVTMLDREPRPRAGQRRLPRRR